MATDPAGVSPAGPAVEPGRLGQGVRPDWSTVAPHVVAAIEGWLGGRIATVLPAVGGFSPAVAATVSTADGRAGFVKVAAPGPNTELPVLYRREREVAAALPDIPALAPLRFHFDDGAWIVLGFDALTGGCPPLPWRAADLTATLAAIATVHDALTPSPVPAQSVGEFLGPDMRSWDKVSGAEAGLDGWTRRHLSTLTSVAARWPAGVGGDTLLQLDLRSDNVVLTADRGPVIVDWPWACTGPRWLDYVGLAPSVAMQGGPQPEELLTMAAQHPDTDALAVAVVGLAGFFTYVALQPPPAGLPTVRAFQEGQAAVLRAWAGRLLDLV